MSNPVPTRPFRVLVTLLYSPEVTWDGLRFEASTYIFTREQIYRAPLTKHLDWLVRTRFLDSFEFGADRTLSGTLVPPTPFRQKAHAEEILQEIQNLIRSQIKTT